MGEANDAFLAATHFILNACELLPFCGGEWDRGTCIVIVQFTVLDNYLGCAFDKDPKSAWDSDHCGRPLNLGNDGSILSDRFRNKPPP